jgi:hypothetical protein
MAGFVIGATKELEEFNCSPENVTVVIIFGGILSNEHLEKIFKFKNIEYLRLLIGKNMKEKLCDKMAMFQKLHTCLVEFYNEDDTIEREIVISNLSSVDKNLMYFEHNLTILNFNYLFDNYNFKNNFENILINFSITNINIFNIDFHSYFLLDNLPNTVEKLQINVYMGHLHIKLNNLPYSLKELVIIHKIKFDIEDKNIIISNVKLPFGCKIKFIMECSYCVM